MSASSHSLILQIVNLWPVELKWLAQLYWSVFQFAVEATLGAMALHLIHSFTGGEWGRALKPAFHTLLRATPLLLFAFLPMIFALGRVFTWAEPASQTLIQSSPDQFRRLCLTPIWFIVRSLTYLTIWAAFSRSLTQRQPQILARALMLLTLLYTVTLAGMDWVMTIDPDWVSTGFGVMYMIACLNAGLALSLTLYLMNKKPDPRLAIDLGNLLLMSALLWIYMNFMQYIVVWSAQDPHETHWYAVRSAGLWSTLIAVIFATHFLIPFPILLARILKSKSRVLLAVATLFMISQFLETILWVMP